MTCLDMREVGVALLRTKDLGCGLGSPERRTLGTDKPRKKIGADIMALLTKISNRPGGGKFGLYSLLYVLCL